MDKLTQLLATTDQNYIVEILIKWNKASKDKELFEVSEAFKRLFTYINKLELDIYAMEVTVSKSMKDKNRAILSRRRTELELEKAVKEIHKKNEQIKLFI